MEMTTALPEDIELSQEIHEVSSVYSLVEPH